MLHVRGVHYDVGHEYEVGQGQSPGNTRPHFETAGVAADMAMIAGQLHANAVRVTGTDLSRVARAAGLALEAGLTVWFSPHPGDLAGDDIVGYLAKAARRAEELRSTTGSVVMVAGCELSLFCAGYLPGRTIDDRLNALTGVTVVPDLHASFSELPYALNTTLGQSVAAIKDHFRGPVTYASAPWEIVDWTPFDLVSVDLYRDSANAAGYRDSLRGYTRFGKPVVVSEFGCCTYAGAADAGGAGFMIFDYDAQPTKLKLKVTGLQRNEAEQSRYLSELLAIFDEEGIHGAFWHTFAGWGFPHRPNPQRDLDLGSFGLVKVIEAPSTDKQEFVLEPKAAFWALAAAYRNTLRDAGRTGRFVEVVRGEHEHLVRQATVSDADVVAELLDAFNREFDTPSPGTEVLAARLRHLIAGDHLVILLGGEPSVGVAVLSWRPSIWYEGPVVTLDELYVRPHMRGQRVGHAMLEAACRVARERGSLADAGNQRRWRGHRCSPFL